MFTNCSGECCICTCGDGCLAGNGDDYSGYAEKEQVIRRLDNGRYRNYTKMMKQYLLNYFNYDYDLKKGRKE